MEHKPLTRSQKIIALCIVTAAISLCIFMAIDSGPGPTPQESREAWRLKKLENQRAKNYIENIKPYVPAK